MESLQELNNFSPLGIAALSLVVLLVYIRLSKRNSKIENNDLIHIQNDLSELRKEVNLLQVTISKHGERLAWIEAKINGK